MIKIVIRQHPRELTDYSLYFKDVKVNKVKAPVELVVLNSPMIKTVVTLFSGEYLTFHVAKNIQRNII